MKGERLKAKGERLKVKGYGLRVILLALCSWLFLPVCAQETEPTPDSTQTEKPKVNQFTLDLNLLARGEIRDGGFPHDPEAENPTDRSMFVLGRGRLTLGYERPHFATKLSMQYAGVWGQEVNRNTFNLYEAWAMLTSKQGLFLQFGRQALSYDDERVIGPDDWSMAGMSHDALRMGWEGFGHKLHIIGAYNQVIANMGSGTTFFANGGVPYKTMQMLWYHYDLPVFPFSASVLFMNIGMQAGEKGVKEYIEWQQMAGAYIKCCPKYCTFEASYYHQFGKEEHGLPINAFMASVKAQVQPSPIYGFTAGYDYLSGDDYVVVLHPGGLGLPQHKVMKGFNPVYGSHHQFYGAMDFFYVSSFVNGFSPGLQNAYAGVMVNPVKGLNITAKYHYMAVTTDLTQGHQKLDKTLGHMAEIELSYQILKDFKVSGGFSYMGGSDTMQRLKRASDDGRLLWGWISLVATPTLVKHKW
jgi:hypothetical protein